MKAVFRIFMLTLCAACLYTATTRGDFDLDDFEQFREQTRELTAAEILDRHRPANVYFKGVTTDVPREVYSYLDVVTEAYELTPAEIRLLEDNHFVVTERVNFPSFGWALGDIYDKDLPVFVSSDLLLHALHTSYDQILMDTERVVIEPKLIALLDALRETFPGLVERYGEIPEMDAALGV